MLSRYASAVIRFIYVRNITHSRTGWRKKMSNRQRSSRIMNVVRIADLWRWQISNRNAHIAGTVFNIFLLSLCNVCEIVQLSFTACLSCPTTIAIRAAMVLLYLRIFPVNACEKSSIDTTADPLLTPIPFLLIGLLTSSDAANFRILSSRPLMLQHHSQLLIL